MSTTPSPSFLSCQAAGRAADLVERYALIRRATEALCEPLSPEDCVVQSMPNCSPAKWHLAHTSWFFETFVLERTIAGYAPFDQHFRVLFNSYYQSVGEQYSRPLRGMLSRPSFEQVLEYRRVVDRGMAAILRGKEIKGSLIGIIELGLHHEQQHQELILTDIKHMFSLNPLQPAYREQRAETDGSRIETAAPAWIPNGGGLQWIGHTGATFAFDNELPRHRVFVEPFEVASRLTTNGEYASFIEDGGYERPEFWLSDGWYWLNQHGWRAPLYWTRTDSSWSIFTLSGTRELDPHEPVCHASYYEAEAFARWSGARLPTEAEWESVAREQPIEGNFVEGGRFHPAPPVNDGRGPVQLFGDVWEWTQSPYTPYPGFQAPDGALGEYNGKFMSNQMVLRGGSCVTPRSHMRATYRNFFPPDARWQFSGIRLARDVR